MKGAGKWVWQEQEAAQAAGRRRGWSRGAGPQLAAEMIPPMMMMMMTWNLSVEIGWRGKGRQPQPHIPTTKYYIKSEINNPINKIKILYKF